VAVPARTVEELSATLERVERKLDALLSRERRSQAAAVGKREAARLLGVDRSTTLEALIRDGVVKTVTVAGRLRITRDEIARVLSVGVPSPSLPHRERRSRMKAAEVIEIGRLRVRDV
jgi:hypothetical protein